MASTQNQKLNKIQLNRLSSKLEQIIAHKKAKWLQKNPSPKPLTLKDRLDSIRSGEAKLRPSSEINEGNYLYLKDAFVFPGELEFRKSEKKHIEDLHKYLQKLESEADYILDQAIFISCEAALEMIKKFETFEP